MTCAKCRNLHSPNRPMASILNTRQNQIPRPNHKERPRVSHHCLMGENNFSPAHISETHQPEKDAQVLQRAEEVQRPGQY